MDKLKRAKKFHLDTFADFVTLVIPKLEQETAKWKYDVRKDAKMLTVYRLAYDDGVAVITDCLCLELCCVPPDKYVPSLNYFVPTYSSRGKKADSLFVRNVIGKSIITSPAQIRFLLGFLDDEHPAGLSNEITNSPAENSTRNNRSHATPDRTEYAGENDDHSGILSYGRVTEKSCPTEELSSPLRRSKSPQNSVSDKPLQLNSRKRRINEKVEKDTGTKLKKVKLQESVDKKPISSGICDFGTITIKFHDCPPVPSVVDDFPSLPVHPSSGGTVFSSQYWTEAAEGRQRLDCTKDVFVDVGILRSLPNLTVPEKSSAKLFAQNVKFGWLLLEHLLGGSKAIGQSFIYTTTDSCPIAGDEVVDQAREVLDAVLEHMDRSFGLWDGGSRIRKEIICRLNGKTKVANRSAKGVGRLNWRTSHMFLRGHLKKNSYPGPKKTQVAFGFDFYLNSEKLRALEHYYKEEYVSPGNRAKDSRKWARFGMELISELVGGRDVLQDGMKEVVGGLMALVGDDILQAVSLRTRKVFDLPDNFSVAKFRQNVASCLGVYKETVDKATSLMASVLFQPTVESATLAPVRADPPAQPGCNYWTTPAPHRTRLSMDSSFYMDTVKLAEYQRYMGPESARKNKDWNIYTWSLIQHAVGGEERLLERLLKKRKVKEGPRTIDFGLDNAVFDHVDELYKAPDLITREKMRNGTRSFFTRQVEMYDRGVKRWHFPEFDDRPNPEALTMLQEQEYWRKPAPDRTQLRPGHDVYIRTKVLESIASYFGPQSKENDIRKYAFTLLAHMLGGVNTALELWHSKNFSEGLRSMFVYDDLVAVCLHSDAVFHLVVSVSPLTSLKFAGEKMTALWDDKVKKEKRISNGARTRQPKNLYVSALDGL